MHLNAPGWNVIGSGEPGLPGVAIGHNERIAWGFTIVGTDQADLYVEETNPDDPTQYKVGDRWEKMTVVRETVRVKGGRGDVPSRAALHAARPGAAIRTRSGTARIALRWVGQRAGRRGLSGESGRGAGDRTSKSSCRPSTRWKVPALNFVYADVDGNIGWVAAAADADPQELGRPAAGARPQGRYEWQGFLAVQELPQTFNPAAHWLATANHNILPEGYPARDRLRMVCRPIAFSESRSD